MTNNRGNMRLANGRQGTTAAGIVRKPSFQGARSQRDEGLPGESLDALVEIAFTPEKRRRRKAKSKGKPAAAQVTQTDEMGAAEIDAAEVETTAEDAVASAAMASAMALDLSEDLEALEEVGEQASLEASTLAADVATGEIEQQQEAPAAVVQGDGAKAIDSSPAEAAQDKGGPRSSATGGDLLPVEAYWVEEADDPYDLPTGWPAMSEDCDVGRLADELDHLVSQQQTLVRSHQALKPDAALTNQEIELLLRDQQTWGLAIQVLRAELPHLAWAAWQPELGTLQSDATPDPGAPSVEVEEAAELDPPEFEASEADPEADGDGLAGDVELAEAPVDDAVEVSVDATDEDPAEQSASALEDGLEVVEETTAVQEGPATEASELDGTPEEAPAPASDPEADEPQEVHGDATEEPVLSDEPVDEAQEAGAEATTEDEPSEDSPPDASPDEELSAEDLLLAEAAPEVAAVADEATEDAGGTEGSGADDGATEPEAAAEVEDNPAEPDTEELLATSAEESEPGETDTVAQESEDLATTAEADQEEAASHEDGEANDIEVAAEVEAATQHESTEESPPTEPAEAAENDAPVDPIVDIAEQDALDEAFAPEATAEVEASDESADTEEAAPEQAPFGGDTAENAPLAEQLAETVREVVEPLKELVPSVEGLRQRVEANSAATVALADRMERVQKQVDEGQESTETGAPESVPTNPPAAQSVPTTGAPAAVQMPGDDGFSQVLTGIGLVAASWGVTFYIKTGNLALSLGGLVVANLLGCALLWRRMTTSLARG